MGGEPLSIDEAYSIQDRVILDREADMVVGAKLALAGCRDGAPEGEVGWLTAASRLTANASLPGLRGSVTVEAEIAAVMANDLDPVAAVDRAAVADAVASFHPALDIIVSRLDPRSTDRRDLVSDNAFAGFHSFAEARINLADRARWKVTIDGAVMAHGTPAGASLDPISALMVVAENLARRGHVLRAGWTVLTGRLLPPALLGTSQTLTVDIDETKVLTINAPRRPSSLP